MENAEEVFHFLEDFSKRKPKTIPQELNDYLAYVARTGDPVYQWPLVKSLFKEKLLNVITDFYETTPGIDIPPYPNVDPFNYDIMKNSLLERLDSFTSAPFTVQRICELLTFPRKQYNRIDKFMRAVEKNILVVSTREPGAQRHAEQENGDAEPIVNGSDNSEYNVDVEMEDMSWKDNPELKASEPQPSSSDTHISVDDIEARLQAKQNTPMETQEKSTPTEYESVTPPELNVGVDDPPEGKGNDQLISDAMQTTSSEAVNKSETASTSAAPVETKTEAEIKIDVETTPTPALVIPEITVDDAEMTEQKLIEQAAIATEKLEDKDSSNEKGITLEVKANEETATEQQTSMDENSSDSNMTFGEAKHISEVSTSSEESSSSSDNTDGNSNSPNTDESNAEVQEESNHAEIKLSEHVSEPAVAEPTVEKDIPEETPSEIKETLPQAEVKSEEYSISDVNSELPQTKEELPQAPSKNEETPANLNSTDPVEQVSAEEEKKDEEKKTDTEVASESTDS